MLVALLLPLDVVSISRCRVKWGRKNSSRDKRVADRGGLGLAEPSVDSSTADAARNDRRTHVAGDHPDRLIGDGSADKISLGSAANMPVKRCD